MKSPFRKTLYHSHYVVPRFSRWSNKCRIFFDDLYDSDRSTDRRRFVWDPWTVPGQYQLLRCPSEFFFPNKFLLPLLTDLAHFGESALGCHKLSTVWLSAYREGDFQNFHADRPHGPWAFVLSLSPYFDLSEPPFLGGNTLILKDEIASYWRSSDKPSDHPGFFEANQIFHSIPPLFNQLTIFDPRMPHGVERLSGVNDIRNGRLVLHGWFTEPNPYVMGSLPSKEVKHLQAKIGTFLQSQVDGELQGTWMFRLQVQPSGKVKKLSCLWDRVFSPEIPRPILIALRNKLEKDVLYPHTFRKTSRESTLTLPVSIGL